MADKWAKIEEAATLKRQSELLKAQLSVMKRTKEHLEEEVHKLKRQLQQQQQSILQLTNNTDELQQRCTQLQKDKEDVKQALARERREKEEAARQMSGLQHKLKLQEETMDDILRQKDGKQLEKKTGAVSAATGDARRGKLEGE